MKYIVINGFCLGNGRNVFPGDTITSFTLGGGTVGTVGTNDATATPGDINDFSAEQYHRQGLLSPLHGAELLTKASLLAAISMAETLEILDELVAPDETDADIIDAYKTRAAELTAI